MKALNFVLLGILLALASCRNQSEIEVKSGIPYAKEPETDVKNMLTDFYTAYITTTSDSIPAPILEKKLDSITDVYCTASLRDSIDKAYEQGLDFDPFLNAQDCEIGMLNSLQVQKSNKSKDRYFVHFLTPGYDSKFTTIDIKVVKSGDQLRIAAIR